jgi:hypothetical protein
LKSKPSEIADCMNNFFVNKVNDLRARIPPCRNSPLDRVRKLMEKRTCKFELQTVHPDVISEVIKNMKSSKSCGIDFIDSYILKLATDELTPGITHIVNLSIKCEHFPYSVQELAQNISGNLGERVDRFSLIHIF